MKQLEPFEKQLDDVFYTDDPAVIIGQTFFFDLDTHFIVGQVTWIGMTNDDGFLELGTTITEFRGYRDIRLMYHGSKNGWMLWSPDGAVTGVGKLEMVE